jgi:hypothetical protein
LKINDGQPNGEILDEVHEMEEKLAELVQRNINETLQN